ncbi:unnamed protein product [Nesidiocoris tenuis]|uniref:Uncharacterized protein n=1 Tax=Nesidiocoris tenuis TaxID=355587 RepID=A0A6H5G1X8_9HEMI|nr:unnamed protein product [Nesidiocoris tenuis]
MFSCKTISCTSHRTRWQPLAVAKRRRTADGKRSPWDGLEPRTSDDAEFRRTDDLFDAIRPATPRSPDKDTRLRRDTVQVQASLHSLVLQWCYQEEPIYPIQEPIIRQKMELEALQKQHKEELEALCRRLSISTSSQVVNSHGYGHGSLEGFSTAPQSPAGSSRVTSPSPSMSHFAKIRILIFIQRLDLKFSQNQCEQEGRICFFPK